MKKIILLSLISGAFLFGNPVQNTQPDKNVQSDKKVEQEANLLEYEKILKRLQEKKDYEEAIKLEKQKIQEENTKVKEMKPLNFNVIGVIKVQNKNYAYLLTRDNKILKANAGMDFEGNKIVSIDSYGVNIENDSHKIFLPITTSQVKESDVIFHSANPNQNMQPR